MNKIYKVIWSKVKHQYVVVSELAHSCTKSTSSRVGRSAAAVLAALVLTTGVCAVPVQAADPTLEELYYEQINRAIQNGETSSPLVTLAEVPATTSAATEDGETAAEEETQPSEDGGVTGTADQYTVVNKDGFYASNTKGTHNTLSKDGLWVGGTNDNTGFHVDNDGNVRTTGRITATSDAGDVIIQNGQVAAYNEDGMASLSGDILVMQNEDGATAYLGNGQLIVSGGVNAGNVKINANGDNTITGLTNTTWNGTTDTPDRAATEGQLGQVQGDLDELNEAAVKYDSDGQGGYTNNVTIGGQVTANSFQNTDGSFSVDANGNVDAETVQSEGMSVVDENGNTTFQVLSNGDVTAHNVTANSYSNVNGTFVADENGKITAEKGDIGDVWIKDGTITNVKDIQAESGNIGDVELAGGKVTAKKGDIGDVWLSEGNISNVKNITAESGNVGDVKLAGGKVTAQKADIGGVFIKNESIQAGNIKINENGSNEITGLSNTNWNDGTPVDKDRAATEGQLSTVQGYVDDLENTTAHIKHVTEPEGTDYTTVEGTKFYADGNIANANDTFKVSADGKIEAEKADIDGVWIKEGSITTEEGTITAGDVKINSTGYERINVGNGNFIVYHDGAFRAANDNFIVHKDGSVEAQGTVQAADATFAKDSRELVTAGQLAAAGIVPGTASETGVAIGENAMATAAYTVAVGEGSQAFGNSSTALGYGAHVESDAKNSVALGANSVADKANTVSVGRVGAERQITNVAAGIERTDAANVGQLEDFQSQVGETIGTGDFSRTNYARGAENVTDAIYDVDAQVKVNSDALDAYEAAGIVAGNEVGQYSNAIALGNNATADGWSAVAIGSNAEAEGSNSVAIGVDSASGALSTAVGAGSTADGTQATALGQNSNALGQGTVSLGANTKADGEGAVSIGFNNSAEAAGSVAIGNGAHVYESGTNSVALGQWSQASDDKVVSVGNDWLKRRITNVAAGTDPTDAVNVQQLTDRTANMVEWDEGTDDTIHGVTLNGGTISAADGKFNVWSSGGMEATYGKFDGNIEAAGGNFKVNGTTGGITTAGGIEAASGITAANGNFNVWNSGGMEAAYGVFEGKITAAGEKFIVDGNGNITTAGQITAANNKFHVWETGGIAIGADTANPLFAVNGNNGDVTTQGEIVAKGMYVGSKDADNAVVTKGDMTDVVGDADFSDTNYAAEAGNVTEAIYDVDEQVKSNSDVLAGYEVAGITSGTNTDGTNSIAIGEYSGNVGSYSVAVGVGAGTSDSYNVAIGAHAQVTGANSVALGYGSYADEDNVVSVGKYGDYRRIVNVADGVNEHDAVNVGQLDEVKSSVSIIGDDLAAYKAAGVVPGEALPDGVEGSMALGTNAKVENAGSDSALAIGDEATVTASHAVAVGAGVEADGVHSLAMGSDLTVTGDNAIGIGYSAGMGTKISGENAIGIGKAVNATDKNTIALGTAAASNKENAISIGTRATVDSYNSIAIGAESGVAEGSQEGVALGYNANVSKNGAIAIGSNSVAAGEGSMALGLGASTTLQAPHSVAIGEGSVADESMVVSVGHAGENGQRRIINVAAGTKDTDAVNVSQIKGMVRWDQDADDSYLEGTLRGVTLSDGTITAANGNFVVTDDPNSDTDSILNIGEGAFRVNENGGFNVNDGAFRVFSEGGFSAAAGAFEVTAGKDGLPAGSVTTPLVTGLTNTDWNATKDYSESTYAATEAQLQAVADEAGKHTQVTVNGGNTDGNLKVTSTDNDGQTTYDISLSDTVTVGKDKKVVTLNGDATNGAPAFSVVTTGLDDERTLSFDFSSAGAVFKETHAGAESSTTINGSKVISQQYVVDENNQYQLSQTAINGGIVTVSSSEADEDRTTIKGADITVGSAVGGAAQTHITNNAITIGGDLTDPTRTALRITNTKNEDGTFNRTITGLTNTAWAGQADDFVSGRAATEDQLAKIQSQVDTNEAAIGALHGNGVDGQSLEKAVAVANQLDGANLSALNALSQIAPMNLNVPMMTNSVLSAPQEASKGMRDPDPNAWGNNVTTEDMSTINNNLTVTGDTHLKGDLEVDGKATFNNGVEITKGNLEMNNNKITGVANGDISETSKDAVNGSQLYGVQQDVEANAKNISTLGGAVNKLGNRIDEVGAGAAALAALHPLDFDPDNKWDFSAGYGNYRGESAVAFGAFYRPNEDTMFSVGGTVGNDDNMVNAGVSLKIGSGSSGVTTSRVAMAKEIKAMRDVVAKQDAQIQKLTAMVNALVGVKSEPDTTTMFPDVPENHWAYEAVATMARSGLVKGYPDGEFKGDRTMTRYEFAQIIQNAIQAGAEVDSRLVEEFKPELEYFHIATVAKDKDGNPTIERVRAN